MCKTSYKERGMVIRRKNTDTLAGLRGVFIWDLVFFLDMYVTVSYCLFMEGKRKYQRRCLDSVTHYKICMMTAWIPCSAQRQCISRHFFGDSCSVPPRYSWQVHRVHENDGEMMIFHLLFLKLLPGLGGSLVVRVRTSFHMSFQSQSWLG